ncbi:glycerol-3-phosphate responsive antiterminator [Lacticaseibacillus parahuelsenbergensis]|uniref:Glycerol uptake operon antiterminator regulatory protein n=1 Tax=Lacticaseibacillus parahuelsenbergensis TaxID=3068305 RepID=A0ABY9L3T3_9LACO|nr:MULTISPECIES: glycerol-3-phosphate responsive antiterminator [Lacticaseibacillus]MDE3281494.1 glycerol-3-phosphate responsive antiterminator [Lacticaseibacillus casei]WLV78412.1 glycerol-3-phosphate responsive antiterminator [Lacticaseibacillus sp. NCIMB 15471]
MLNTQTVIPSSLKGKNLKLACQSSSPIVLIAGCSIGNLQAFVTEIHRCRKQAFVHIDLIAGFKPDTEGMKLLKMMYKVDGIISTNFRALMMGKELGMATVYRVFLLDSRSIDRASSVLSDENFSAVEILPSGYAVQEVETLHRYLKTTDLIAGGFIRSKEDLIRIFAKGFKAVTTSDIALWR